MVKHLSLGNITPPATVTYTATHTAHLLWFFGGFIVTCFVVPPDGGFGVRKVTVGSVVDSQT